MPTLNGQFNVTSWDEQAYDEGEGERKLTRASVTQDVSGDIVGTGKAEWLMSYGPDGTAHFVGLQKFEGAIDDRKGSVVLETVGDFDGAVAAWEAKVVSGSGTQDWASMRGQGRFEAPHGSKASFTFDCTLD